MIEILHVWRSYLHLRDKTGSWELSDPVKSAIISFHLHALFSPSQFLNCGNCMSFTNTVKLSLHLYSSTVLLSIEKSILWKMFESSERMNLKNVWFIRLGHWSQCCRFKSQGPQNWRHRWAFESPIVPWTVSSCHFG